MTSLENKLFKRKLIWINVKLYALAGGFLCGSSLFAATNWLVIKGGENVGQHLSLLNQFFIGYSVSFWGSIVGFFYAFLTGGTFAGLLAYLYNRFADVERN